MKKLFLSIVALVLLAGVAQAAINNLERDLTGTGMNQGDLFIYFANIRDKVNEIADDHPTNRTNMTETETLIEEMHDDHATFKTHIDEIDLDYEALLVDITAVRAAILGITAQLDLDAGVTDTTYASGNDPAALTATSIAATATATLTAPKPASPAAALTNSANLTLSAP